MPPAFQMHVFRIRVVKLAVAQLAIENKELAFVLRLDILFADRLNLAISFFKLSRITGFLRRIFEACLNLRCRPHGTNWLFLLLYRYRRLWIYAEY